MADKALAVLRFAKIKDTGSLRGALAHNLRVSETPNADPTKKHLNSIPKGIRSMNACQARFEQLLSDQKVRKNAVLAHEAIVSGSPEALGKMTREDQKAYFQEALSWLCKLHGGNDRLVSVAVHYDEKTPHMHAIFVPLDSKNKLNSRSILGGHAGRLRELQTDFAVEVSEKHGLHRGLMRSKAKHTTLKEYGALVEQELPRLEAMKKELQNEITKLEWQKHEVRALVKALANEAEPFLAEMKKYLKAAQISPQRAEWHRVQREYEQIPSVAQNALQSVYEGAKAIEDEDRKFRRK